MASAVAWVHRNGEVAKKKAAKAFTPRLRVTLRAGNEFEGETYELIHEADTLSSLLAEQEALKAARKKYKYGGRISQVDVRSPNRLS